MRRHLASAGISAGVVLFAAAFFVLGFAAHATIDDDDAAPAPSSPASAATPVAPSTQGSPGAQPTPAPLAQASGDDDPFIGPEDASVTVIEFADYQ